MVNTEWWNLMVQGKFVDALFQVYVGIFGDFVYAMLLAVVLIVAQIKGEDFGLTLIVGLLTIGGMATFLPVQVQTLALLGIAMGMAAILYNLVTE